MIISRGASTLSFHWPYGQFSSPALSKSHCHCPQIRTDTYFRPSLLQYEVDNQMCHLKFFLLGRLPFTTVSQV